MTSVITPEGGLYQKPLWLFLKGPFAFSCHCLKYAVRRPASSRLSNASQINVLRIFLCNWHDSETFSLSESFKSNRSLLKAIRRRHVPYFTWHVFCLATYMLKTVLFCLANTSALHSSKMTRFWYFFLLRKSIECQSSSQPHNAPFPQQRFSDTEWCPLAPCFSLTLLILSVFDLSLQTLWFSK